MFALRSRARLSFKPKSPSFFAFTSLSKSAPPVQSSSSGAFSIEPDIKEPTSISAAGAFTIEPETSKTTTAGSFSIEPEPVASQPAMASTTAAFSIEPDVKSTEASPTPSTVASSEASKPGDAASAASAAAPQPVIPEEPISKWWWVPSPKTFAILSAVFGSVAYLYLYFRSQSRALEAAIDGIACERAEVVNELQPLAKFRSRALKRLLASLLSHPQHSHGMHPETFAESVVELNGNRGRVTDLHAWEMLSLYRNAPPASSGGANSVKGKRLVSLVDLAAGASLLVADEEAHLKLDAAFSAADADADNELSYAEVTRLIGALFRTGHISARSCSVFESYFPPKYAVRPPDSMARLVFKAVELEENQPIPRQKFFDAAQKLTDSSELVFWYLMTKKK